VLSRFHIHTAAGEETTVSASGEQVESSSDGTCPAQFVLPDIPVGVCHHAKKLLLGDLTIGGTGCHLQTADYDFVCAVGKSTKDGTTIAHGVYEGYAEAQLEIGQTGSDDPTLTFASTRTTEWFISSPLSKTNPDADYPTWSVTLRMHLTMTTPSSGS